MKNYTAESIRNVGVFGHAGEGKPTLVETILFNTGLVDPKVGQYVLVHAGCAIEVMEKDKAEELIELFADIEELGA